MNYTNEGINKYVSNINKIPLLTKEEEKLLLQEYRNTKDQKIAHKLITANLKFVLKVAHTYRGYGHPLSDLIQEGNKALIRALEKFNPDKEVRFCSYAVYWIKAYMGNYVMKNHSIVKFGSKKTEKDFFYNLKKVKEIMEKNGFQDLTKELSEYFNVSEQEILINYNRLNIRDSSLEAKVSSDFSSNSYIDFYKSNSISQDEFLSDKQKDESVQEVISSLEKSLTERELYIIKNRLSSDEPLTLAEIGDRYGISRERTRQIEERLIKKLKKEFQQIDY